MTENNGEKSTPVPNAILGRKLGMTRIFTEEGESIPVTVIEAGPCHIVSRKTTEKDGYDAVQIGFSPAKKKKVNKPLAGHFKKAGIEPLKHLTEVRVNPDSTFELGSRFDVGIFKPGDAVAVTGISKGLGFQGTVRRYNFRGGPRTHGQSDRLRAPGSIGASSYPSRVWKGQRMPGRMGNRTTTIKNLKVIEVDPEKNLLLLKGAVPGKRNSLLRIRSLAKSPV